MEIIHAPHSSIDRVTPAHTGFSIFSASYIQDDPRASVWRHQHIPFYNAHDKLHTHQEHEILLVEHGTGEYITPQETFSISPGQIVVLPSASPHDLIKADG